MRPDDRLRSALDDPFEVVESAVGGAHAIVRPEALRALTDGHFPGNPLVPGSHLLALFVALVRATGHACSVDRIERAVFREVVRPDARVVVRASAAADDWRVVEALVADRQVARARLHTKVVA